MSFGRDFRAGLLGTDYLRDFKHGERIFVADTMALAPKLKFLYHTYFGLNTSAIPYLRSVFSQQNQAQIGVLAKTVELPGFDIQTESLNQYNRTRIVQTGIKYQPVTITLHDDGNDIVRTLWRQYYMYYYGDAQGQTSQAGNRDIYDQSLRNYNWGYSGEPISSTASPGVKPPFFSYITVYGLNKKTNVGYKLINPVIKNWKHDTYDYSAGGEAMEHTVTVEYEYAEYLGHSTQLPGFGAIDAYDTAPSPLGQAGSTASIAGPGGVLDSIAGIFESDSLVEAALKAARTIEGAKKITKPGIKEETRSALTGIIRSTKTGIIK